MANTNDFLGRGWKFPPEIDSSTGRFKTAEYEEDIREAIYIILMTKYHERIMMPEFGSNIQEYVFSQKDFTTLNLLKQEVMDALIRWEPRIMNVEVEIEEDGRDTNKLNINIKYTARATNNPFNLVYPFYVNEGIGE
jgi:uncharacterized protein